MDVALIVSISSLVVSALGLSVSMTVGWLTLVRRGRLHATRPTLIAFGTDGGPPGSLFPKVFFRTVLYATGNRGQLVEHLYVKITRRDATFTISHWVYGERSDLVPGSGLYVGPQGFTANHHFVVTRESERFTFVPGEYTIDLLAVCVGETSPRHLFRAGPLHIGEPEARSMAADGSARFDWSTENASYAFTPWGPRPPRAAT